MKVLTRRSGTVLHASKACPELTRGGPVLELNRSDTLAHAKTCREGRCASAFVKASAT